MSIRSEVIRIMNEVLAVSKKISELPPAGAITGAELIEIVQGGANVQSTVSAIGGGGGGSGTVTSFSAGNLSPLFTTSVATSTTTPALSFVITNQNANIVYAGPATGAAAAPTFRSLVAADIPDLSATYLTGNETITLSGQASGSGATGITVTLDNAAVIGKVLTGYVSGAGTVADTDTILQAIQKLNGNIGLSLVNPMTDVGDIIQGTTAGAPARLASVATGNVLISGGVTTANSWGKVTSAHVDSSVATTAAVWLLASGGTLSGNNTIAQVANTVTWTYTGTGTTIPQTYTNSITASANSQVMTTIDVNNTFATGGFTGTTNVGLRLRSGRVGLNVGTDTITATLLVEGEGATSATTCVIFRNSANSEIASWGNHGQMSMGTSGSAPGFGPGTYTTGAFSISGTSWRMNASLIIDSTPQGIKLTGSSTLTGSDIRSFWDSKTYNFTSGTNTSYALDYDPTFTGVVGLTKYGVVIHAIDAFNGFGLGATLPSALVHVGAGTTTVPSVRILTGTLLTTALAGAFEYNNSFYGTKNSTLRFGIGGTIFENFTDVGNSGTSETDLYTYTTPANTLATNGEQIQSEYGGVFVSSGTATRQVRIYFGGTAIFDSGALTLSLSSAWTVYVTIVRVSSTVIRYAVSFTTQGAALSAYTSVGELTGLTLSNTNILKITGQAAGVGAATDDIVAKIATGSWHPAANN